MQLTGKVLLLALMMGSAGTLSAQDDSVYAALREGTFHYYSNREHSHAWIFRSGDTEWMNDDRFPDTAMARISWLAKDEYTEQYLSGYDSLPRRYAASIRYARKHLYFYKIEQITPDYYVAQERVDKRDGKTRDIDTIWFHERAGAPMLPNPEPVPGFEKLTAAEARKAEISDSSQYALLYLYRAPKFLLSLAINPVKVNGQILMQVQNNSAYIFKIRKEGTFLFHTKIYKDSVALNLDIAFGKSYYLRMTDLWGVYNRLYNFKLELKEMDPDTGEKEFILSRLR